MKRMILVSTHRAMGEGERDRWLDYQPHINREIRFIDKVGNRNIYTITNLRSYPAMEDGSAGGFSNISLTGWWIGAEAAFRLMSRGVV